MKNSCKTKIKQQVLLWLVSMTVAANAAILVDFDMTGRSTAEVTEPGQTAWPVAETTSASMTISGITFTVSKAGSAGTAIKTDWYKAGIQNPYYARLVCDGLTVVDGNSGGSIQMTIAGLSAGTHSLLTYHNTLNGYDHAEVDVTVNGIKMRSNLAQTNRATTTAGSAYSYVTFTVTAGQTVTILYSANTNSSSSYKNVVMNGFGLDVPDAAKQAASPFPADRDLHVDADAGTVQLSWTKASNAASHDVYFATDSLSVATATRSSALYLGNQTTTGKGLSGLSNLKTYYWRVDEVDASGTITIGNVWRFSPRHLAFPGAEGYGRFARGGRGGTVVHVTNLNDAGAGSLREAVENDIGPRTIVFDVAGIITLQSRLTLSNSNITIAGQTAPGKGIVVRSAPLGFSGVSDGIMRFVRVRLGAGQTFDGTGLQGSDHCIFDHNSVSWTIDESFSSRSGKNITLQKTMLAEALNIAGHQNYPSGTKHGYAATISGDVGSFHHNLLAHNEGRNWSLGGGLDANGTYSGRLDIFNNVVYNWGGRSTDGGAHEVNFVNNYYKPGPATVQNYALNAQWDGFPGTQQYFCSGNFVKGKYESIGVANNGCTHDGGNPNPWVSSSFFSSYATLHSAAEAYKHVLSDVGATQPAFDDHDKRIVKETWLGTTTYKGSVSGVAGLPDHQDDVGGYESYPTTARPADFDADGDGMPNWWENSHGLNPSSGNGNFSESNGDLDGDGYTNLEEYLNWLALPHATVNANSQATFNMAELSRGFQKTPVYSLTPSTCATASIADSILTITSKKNCPVFEMEFSVTDREGSILKRSVALHDSTAKTSTVNLPPYFTSNDTFIVQENTQVVGMVVATDPEGNAVSYSLAASSDEALFGLDASTGELRFLAAPDYENPLDNGANNIFHLQIVASDGVLADTLQHIVIVTDLADESPTGPGIHKKPISTPRPSKIQYDMLGRWRRK